MSSSSSYDNSDSQEYIPFGRRPEWADVVPLEQDDGPDPVVKINYSQDFVDVFNYFRAIYKSGEVSERAFELTKEAANTNAANYTVWHHRRTLLKALIARDEDGGSARLKSEVDFIRWTIEANPKNYQVWQHRRALVELTADPSNELQFCTIILSGDAKNYHAWEHRQWVNRKYGLYDGELDYVEGLLEDDIRNNSAWNHRFFVLSQIGEGLKEIRVLKREVDFAKTAISKVPGNESAWNYLRGLVDNCQDEAGKVEIRDDLEAFCLKLRDEKKVENQLILGALVDLYRDKLEETEKKEEKADILKKIKALTDSLASKVDVIRKEYWSFIDRDLHQKFSS